MPDFPEALERRVEICARPETVFRYFTDSQRFARWWGEGSRIDPRPGGEVLIRYPNGVEVKGEVVEIDPPRKIAFTYRYATGIPAGGSLVTILLAESAGGTILDLRHAFSSAKIRDAHIQGWRYQLALFSKTVAEEGLPGVVERIDAYLAAWCDADPEVRRSRLSEIVTPGIVFRDLSSMTTGLEDLLANLEAIRSFVPDVTLARDGEVRLSHGTAAARWIARHAGGELFGRGLNVYDLAPDGRIARVVGFWEGK